MRILSIALLMMVSIGAWADVKVLYGEKGLELEAIYGTITIGQKELTGGTVIISQEDQKNGTTELTLAVTPDKGYRLAENGLEVYTVAPADISQTRAVTASTKLDIKSEDFKDEASKRTYTATIDSNLALWLKSATFALNESKGNRDAVTYTYYALHANGKGYMKQRHAAVANDGTFRYENVYDGNGYSIWVYSSDGYLTNDMYYLCEANGTLVLSDKPSTKWDLVTDGDKQRFQLKGSTKIIGLNSSSAPTLDEPANLTNKYAACEMTVSESSWTGPNEVSFTVRSPQIVTYQRTYYKRKLTATIIKNDAGNANSKVVDNKEVRVFQKLTYKSSSAADKGTAWDFDESNAIIYNKKSSGDVTVTATYTITSFDPIAAAAHPATDVDVTLKIQPAALTPDPAKNYLLFYTKEANYRFPYDTNTMNENDVVNPQGKKDVLTDPDISPNGQISWKVEVDAAGFVSFKNVETGRYLYYDATDYTHGSNYGVVKVGATSLPANDNRYKFRLYQPANHNTYGVCQTIIPYDLQFVVGRSDGDNGIIYDGICCAWNVYKDNNIISLWKGNGDSKWKIYAYEAENRLRSDWTINGPNSASETGTYNLTATANYSRNIVGSPANNRDLEIAKTYTKLPVKYNWTVSGINSYITTTNNSSNGDGKLAIEVNSMPVSNTLGTVKCEAYVDAGTYTLTVDKVEREFIVAKKIANNKSVAFNLYSLSTEPSNFTEISSLSQITGASGYYKLTADCSDNVPAEITEFTGWLDGNNHTVSGLSAPLFAKMSGSSVVRNLNLKDVSISASGKVGAICAEAAGNARIYNVGILSGNVGSSDDYCGGLVGLLDGSARVINCFSYANITGGTYVGGIVGYNNYATTSVNMMTMVMNCMFYGDFDTDNTTNRAPIYNGKIITNRGDANGVSNFNYFWAGASYVQDQKINTYNCALIAETRFLQRFEFFRPLLNSNRALAAWWATGSRDNKDKMAKWVLETADRTITSPKPYPILKPAYDSNSAIIKYPSVVNIDAAHAEAFFGNEEIKKTQYNQGRKFGTLTINIQMGSDGDGDIAPIGASITKSQVTPNITDKDPEHFNFNYYKVQLPYYNDVGTNNYTKDANGISRVVTGWKIVKISDGDHDFSTTGSDASATVSTDENTKDDITLTTPYNFADRKCTAKDLYSDVNKRVFNQGAYFDVPEGVTSITIEPYWAKCVYVSDQYPDVVYNQDMSSKTDVAAVGGGERYKNNTEYSINGISQKVYTSMSSAVSALSPSGKVYDNAIVLVGNVHSLSLSNTESNKPFTIMSIDLDKDNEPDYSYILRFNGRVRVHPVRIDFLNVIGLGMAQKSSGGTGTYNFGIMQPYGWFECTNTGLFRVTQLEYDMSGRTNSPIILHGGVIEQWVTYAQKGSEAQTVQYYHVGGNVWFKEFHVGRHQDETGDNAYSPHPPISVTGGDYDEFYLTGLYNTPKNNYDDNAECYINGGRFGKVAGTGMQGIGNKTNHTNGNIIWQIDNADIDEFYAGGTNAAHIAEGDIYTVISNSRVDQFCGGPKFGNMNSDKKVVTNATNCTFRTFFGAGYGGNSYNRRYPKNLSEKINIDWNTWLTGDASYDYSYSSEYGGVETRIDYQFIPMSDNKTNVCRLFVDYVSFSLATTHDVTSKLTGCTITTSPLGRLNLTYGLGNFYGGGSLGKVTGPVKSTLTNCTIEGNVFGAGYSASKPTVAVMNNSFQTQPHYDENLGAYLEAKLPATEPYTWEHAGTVNNTATAINTTTHKLFTTVDLDKSNLGSVNGNVTLTIKGDSKIGTDGNTTKGNVFGGGEASYVTGADHTVTVNIQGNTQVFGNVYGGGDKGVVQGSATVNIEN